MDRADLVRSLQRLSSRQRQAVVLHHLAGFDVREVAAAMRVSPNSVKKFLTRGMVGLRADSPGPGKEGSDV